MPSALEPRDITELLKGLSVGRGVEADRGELHRPLLTELARRIATFHSDAEIHAEVNGSAAIETVLALNEQCPDMAPVFGASAVDDLRLKLRAALDQHRALLDQRARSGKLRRCHDDLHLGNICLVDGRPALFDCIEFNNSIAIIDVLYDLAFLLMDLWEKDRRNDANWLLNRYLDENDETDGMSLLPMFMALRASIRAQVLATQANMPGTPDRAAIVQRAHSYFSLAVELLQPVAPGLLAIGGLSGTGKSTFAASIAHEMGAPPGARVLSSDRIRKQLAGVPAETVLPSNTYTPESSKRVYSALYERALMTLAAGGAVVADAVFGREAERREIESRARQAGVAFKGVWLEASTDALIRRVGLRRGDPSDATPEVVLAQLRNHSRPQDWLIVAADSPPTAAVLAEPAAGFVPAWDKAPEGWNWRAQDADGRWYWYAVEPTPGMAGGVWRSPRRSQQYAGEARPNPTWHQTCEKRPDTKADGEDYAEDS